MNIFDKILTTKLSRISHCFGQSFP